jgi:hypothetical protein
MRSSQGSSRTGVIVVVQDEHEWLTSCQCHFRPEEISLVPLAGMLGGTLEQVWML